MPQRAADTVRIPSTRTGRAPRRSMPWFMSRREKSSVPYSGAPSHIRSCRCPITFGGWRRGAGTRAPRPCTAHFPQMSHKSARLRRRVLRSAPQARGGANHIVICRLLPHTHEATSASTDHLCGSVVWMLTTSPLNCLQNDAKAWFSMRRAKFAIFSRSDSSSGLPKHK